ncbi:hypothetical protein GCM10022380_47500 [Amycolatopsis tucumanensis]|uniref:Uncharacterized protein n=1 Tax=Amycolatopsis tucumanensis TaxID=401106 RepID=A0ABP7IP61_9PSEU
MAPLPRAWRVLPHGWCPLSEFAGGRVPLRLEEIEARVVPCPLATCPLGAGAAVLRLLAGAQEPERVSGVSAAARR